MSDTSVLQTFKLQDPVYSCGHLRCVGDLLGCTYVMYYLNTINVGVASLASGGNVADHDGKEQGKLGWKAWEVFYIWSKTNLFWRRTILSSISR